MRWIAKLTTVLSAALALPSGASAQTITFADQPLAALPADFDHR